MAELGVDRHCAAGNHFRPVQAFRLVDRGLMENFQVIRPARRARDCIACELAKRERTKRRQAPGMSRRARGRFPGLDIDAIHYKLGRVKKVSSG